MPQANISTANYNALQTFSKTVPPPLHLHKIDDHQSGSDTVNNEKLGFRRQMGWDMKADWSAGSGFLSEWLLINGADEGHNSSPAQDCHSARPLSDHSCPHAAGLLLTLFCFFYFLFFVSIWKNPRLFVIWETQATHSLSLFLFFFFFTTHTFGEREKTLRESVAADLSKIKPFLPPISLESQSVLNDFQNPGDSSLSRPLTSFAGFKDQKGTQLVWDEL